MAKEMMIVTLVLRNKSAKRNQKTKCVVKTAFEELVSRKRRLRYKVSYPEEYQKHHFSIVDLTEKYGESLSGKYH